MNKYVIRVLSVAFGALFLYSCSGSNPNIETAKLNVDHKDYQQALAAINKAIAEDSANAEAYYYRGYIYSKIAQSDSNAAQSVADYKRMNTNYDKARALYKSQGKPDSKEMTLMRMTSVNLWTDEHNAAVHLAANDSTRKPGDLDKAVRHLRNAIAISPDSVISYEVLAEVYNMQNKPDSAESVLERVLRKTSKPPVDDYLRLAQLYQHNKKYDQSVRILKQAKQQYPDSVKVTQSLANTYLAMGDDENAVEAVKSLIATDSSNVQYHLVYGTELYKMALTMNDTLTNRYDRIFNYKQQLQNKKDPDLQARVNRLQSKNKQLASDIEDLTNKAEVQLKYVISKKPNDPIAYNTMGVIYQNKAAALFQLRNNTSDLKKADSLDSAAKATLRKALPYYEKAAQLDPGNKQYWQSLFRVYTALGMKEKAQDAMKKAGLQ